MMAAEAFKIMVAQAILAGLDMEMHTLVYDEKLNQLKHDFEEKWLFQHDGAIASDLKEYLKEFAKIHRIKPEERSQLEDYTSTQDDFRETMTFLGEKLNESGKVHIILMDEVDLKNVASIKSHGGTPYLDVDLSYLAQFENVKFIMCLRPTIDGCKNFKIEYSKKMPNQYIQHFQNRYRNCKQIFDLLSFWQQNDDSQTDGFPMISEEENLNVEWFPPCLNSGVIWIPMTMTELDEAQSKIYSIIDEIELEGKHSIAILYDKPLDKQQKSKTFAKRMKKQKETWSGPHEHFTFNGGESDVVIYICESALSLQTMARAKKLLIIVTYERNWNNGFLLLKDAIFKHDLGTISLPCMRSQEDGLGTKIKLKNCHWGTVSDFSTIEGRLQTFENWPSTHPIKPLRLAEAGFFSEGNGDEVFCFKCRQGLTQFEPEDDPWTEHAKYSPSCEFVKEFFHARYNQ